MNRLIVTMPLLHIRLFSDKTSISVPQGLRKANFKLKGYRVLFTQDKHGYYHASVNTNLIQNGSVIAFTTINAPTSSTYDIPLLLNPDEKQTVYENCDWNLGYIDNLPSSVFFNITFFNCIQRTRFDRAFFNTNNNGFQNLFNNVAQGTLETITVNDYNGRAVAFFHDTTEITVEFRSKVNLQSGHSVVFQRQWCNEIVAGTVYYVKNVTQTPQLEFEDPLAIALSVVSDIVDKVSGQVTDPIYRAKIQLSATLGGSILTFTGTANEDNLVVLGDGGVAAYFSYSIPATITQADINKKFEKTPLYPYLPGSDYVTGYQYNAAGKIIGGTGILSTTSFYPSAAKYVNTGVHIHTNEVMDELYDSTCVSADEGVQYINSNGFIQGSGINRNAIIYPYTVDLIFEYS